MASLIARLQAIQAESENLHVALTFDGCDDGGWDIVQSSLALPDFHAQKIDRSDIPNAGRARRAAMSFGKDILRQRYGSTQLDSFLLLSTDADTLPDPDWVRSARQHLDDVEIVAGYTRLDNADHCPQRKRLEAYLERLHTERREIDPITYDPAPSHPFVGGANLGVRLSAYEAIGGVRPLANGEDRDFVKRGRLAGFKVRHARDMKVTTSARQVGRATSGLAAAICETEAGPIQVEHPFDAVAHYRSQARLRQLFQKRDVDQAVIADLAIKLGISAQAFCQELKDAPSADAFVTRVSDGTSNARVVALSMAGTLLDSLASAGREVA
ncbi:MAG: glycosyltransferase family 2 protein [Parvularcula sp.]|nr:glycosyltransferase family 2 protein [Parvularcula sp.]